jgi:Domain of unknown function (DUF4431)
VSLARYIAIFAMLPGMANAAPCVGYGAHTVVGTIHRVMFYGPPNFGEDPKTDEKGFYPVLKLDRATSMCAEDPRGFANGPVVALEMQMIFLSHIKFSKIWYGKHVEVDGAMFAAETGSHHTPVMLEVKNIRVTP